MVGSKYHCTFISSLVKLRVLMNSSKMYIHSVDWFMWKYIFGEVGINIYSCTSVLQIMVHCTVVMHKNNFLKMFKLGTVLVPDKITSLPLLFMLLNVLVYEILQCHLLWKFVAVFIYSKVCDVLFSFIILKSLIRILQIRSL